MKKCHHFEMFRFTLVSHGNNMLLCENRRVYQQYIQYTNTSMAIQKDLLSIEYTYKLTLNHNTNPNPEL